MQEKTILITGISSGLGEGIARAYLERGSTVYGVSRRSPAALLADFPERLHWRSLDLKEVETGRQQIAEWLEGLPALDGVVLNAGILPPIADLAEASLETMRETMEVNVWANHWLLDAIFATVPTVRQVVAISSGASVSGSRGWNAYAISKAALNMWVKLYAAERPESHFTSFAPGLIDTAMQAYIRTLGEDERFATVDRLKAAAGTASMPDGLTAGRRCVEVFAQLLNKSPSGAFVDIRDFA